MAWVRLDDSFLDHPKFARIDAHALRAWLRALCFCNRHGTGGFVSNEVLARIGVTLRIRTALTKIHPPYRSGLWEEADGGVRIHDYGEYQLSDDLRAKRAAAGRKGGLESGERRRSDGVAKAASQPREPETRASRSSREDGAPCDNGSESHKSDEALASFCSEPRPVPSRPDPKKLWPPVRPLQDRDESTTGVRPADRDEFSTRQTESETSKKTGTHGFGYADAKRADEDVAQRAQAADGRPPSTLTPLGAVLRTTTAQGAPPGRIRSETTPEEIEARREQGRRGLAELANQDRAAGAKE
jgi:hypothetical protein